jgi:hypothetical protein
MRTDGWTEITNLIVANNNMADERIYVVRPTLRTLTWGLKRCTIMDLVRLFSLTEVTFLYNLK